MGRPVKLATLLEQSGGRCTYCKVALTLTSVTRDHVVPESRGGREIVAACWDCNHTKGDRSVAWFLESDFLRQRRVAVSRGRVVACDVRGLPARQPKPPKVSPKQPDRTITPGLRAVPRWSCPHRKDAVCSNCLSAAYNESGDERRRRWVTWKATG